MHVFRDPALEVCALESAGITKAALIYCSPDFSKTGIPCCAASILLCMGFWDTTFT